MLNARRIWEASGLPFARFRETVRANTATVNRYLDQPMPILLADAWCIRIGRHPAEVFGFDLWAEEANRA